MQPCSQPRYGFKLVSKPTSGLLFRVMIDLVPSRKYCVARRGCSSLTGSTSTQSTSVRSTCSFSNRFAGLQDAPRPRMGTELWGGSLTTGRNFFFAAIALSSHEHIAMSRLIFCCARVGLKKAEGVRFELTRPFGLPVFKTGAINRSATPPSGKWIREECAIAANLSKRETMPEDTNGSQRHCYSR